MGREARKRRKKARERKSAGAAVAAAIALPPKAYLTPRERDVAVWVVRGSSNVDIALVLNLSRFTVRDHISQMLRKFGVPGRKELVPLLQLALLQEQTPRK